MDKGKKGGRFKAGRNVRTFLMADIYADYPKASNISLAESFKHM